jgi:CheY-like chemotaxis protein
MKARGCRPNRTTLESSFHVSSAKFQLPSPHWKNRPCEKIKPESEYCSWTTIPLFAKPYAAHWQNIEVVGEAGDGEEALARVEHLRPAVVIMDIYMARMDGITATRLIKAQYPQVAVIGLTIEQKDFQLYAMHKAGALEVIGKENVMAELPGAIRRAVAHH